MIERIKKDREMLKGLFLILILSASTFFAIATYQDPIPSVLKPFLRGFLAVLAGLVILTAVYIYKMYQWRYASKALSWLMAILFAACSYKFGLITLIIVIVIIWQTKQLITHPVEKPEHEK
jgi:uncharacterized membrane protein